MKLLQFLACALLVCAVFPVAAQQPEATLEEPVEFNGLLEAHNALRRPLAAPDLAWSPSAARWAQGWANELASKYKCQARHSKDPARQNLGENVYQSSSRLPYVGYQRTATDAVNAWAAEAGWYDEENNVCNAPPGKTCEHYTQAVWSRTSTVGCGRARCKSAEVWVCNYLPRGNTHPTSRPYEPNERPPVTLAAPESEISPARYRESGEALPLSILPEVSATPAPAPEQNVP